MLLTCSRPNPSFFLPTTRSNNAQTDTNYFKNGKCVESGLIVRVAQNTSFGATFDCVTCVREGPLPKNARVSLSNPAATARCTINAAEELDSVKPLCMPCEACVHAELCKSDDSGFYLKPETCDKCVQCDDSARTCTTNNNGRTLKAYGGYGSGDPALCLFGGCVQCLDNKRCDNTHYCYNYNCG